MLIVKGSGALGAAAGAAAGGADGVCACATAQASSSGVTRTKEAMDGWFMNSEEKRI